MNRLKFLQLYNKLINFKNDILSIKGKMRDHADLFFNMDYNYPGLEGDLSKHLAKIKSILNDLKMFYDSENQNTSNSQLDSEWSNPLFKDSKSTVQKLQKVDEIYSSFGACVSSLGDDTISVDIVAPNHTIDELQSIYDAITKWLVEAKKSLASPFNGEFLREQPHHGFLIHKKFFAEYCNIEVGSFVTNVVTCKPTGNVMTKLIFGETMPSESPLICELGQFFTLLNLQAHPRIDIIIDKFSPYCRFKLFTQATLYVPVWNVDAWKKAGKPDQSSYHIKIKDLRSALSVAGKEAEWLEKKHKLPASGSPEASLTRVLGRSWVEENMSNMKASEYLPQTRLARYCDAINKGDQTKAHTIIEEVSAVSTDYYIHYNYPDEPESSDDDTSETHEIEI